MDSLLESAKTFIDVLRNCSSDKVASWKAEDLERAVNWAEYFKRVHSRMQKKASLVGKFDAQLKEMGLQAGMRFGNQELSSEFLGESLSYLLTTLLENPSLPHEIRLLIQQKHATEDQLRHVESMSQMQTLFTALTTIHSKLTAHLPPHAPAPLKGDPLLVANALALQDEIDWILSQQRQQPHTTVSSFHTLPSHLNAKLEDLVKQEQGLEVVLLSTVSHLPSSSSAANPRAAGHSTSENTTPTAPPIILHWLEHKLGLHVASETQPTSSATQPVTPDPTACPCVTCSVEEDASVAEQFWLLSPYLLASIAARNLDFFCTYFKLLMSRVNKLQEKVVQEFENSHDTEQNKHAHLEKLENDVLPHCRALSAVDPKVRDVTTALVSSQVEETAAKVLAISTCPAITPGESGGVRSSASSGVIGRPLAAKHPVNLWRVVAENLNVLCGSPW